MLRNIIFGLMILILGACSKKEETPAVPKTGVELIAVGPVNFGGILIGDTRDAAIRVFNHGPESLDTTPLMFTRTFFQNPAADIDSLSNEDKERLVIRPPFYIQSISNECSSGILQVGKNCVVAIRFIPQLSDNYNEDFKLGNSVLNATGRGMIGGTMSLSETFWDVSSIVAGEVRTKDIFVSNLGDYTIPAPQLQLPFGFSVGTNLCGNFIQTQKTCRIQLIYNKTTSGEYDENVVFNALDGGTIPVRVVSEVMPSEPSGLISFVNVPVSIVADGESQYTVETNPIKDQYGNVVADGTNINFNTNGVSLITPNQMQTVDGKVTFTFQASTGKGFVTVSLLSGEANGFIRVFASSGPASGTIEVQSYNNTIVANGQAQTLFKLMPLRDQFGNIVEDGTQVFYFIQGGGQVSAPFNYTYLGIAEMAVTSPTVAGTAIFQIRSGPIYDEDNNIIDWRASGDYPVIYEPGLASGTIPMTANFDAIYASEDAGVEDEGIPIRSTITVGPIRDAHGNIVKENSPFTLVLENGKNITYQNQMIATVHTNASGMISFIVAGNGNRGEIIATITGGSGAYGQYKIWAFYNNRISPSNSLVENRFQAFETFHDASTLPPLNKIWGNFGAKDFSAFQFNDTNRFLVRHSVSNSLVSWMTGLPYFRYPCWFSRENYVQEGLCQRDEYEDTVSLAYLTTNVLGLDTAPTGPGASFLYSQRHNPGDREPWEEIFGEPRESSPAFIPSANLYMTFGGLRYSDPFDDFCPQKLTQPDCITGTTSCQWDVLNMKCIYQNGTILSGTTSDWTSYWFDMNRVNQPIGTSSAHGGQDFAIVGEYPPAMANLATVSNGNNLLYAFGGYATMGLGGNAYNQLHVFNGNTRKWSSIMPEPDPNEYPGNGEPSPRYQNGIGYVPELKKLFIGGGVRKYDCYEALTKGYCHQFPNCSWNDYEASNCRDREIEGLECASQLPVAANARGQFCEVSSCTLIRGDRTPYENNGNAQVACNQRKSCQWNVNTERCDFKPGMGENIQSSGWTDAKDLWELDLSEYTDPNSETPKWKKLCDSQEPFLDGNSSVANPAYRDCGFPAGAMGVPTAYPLFESNPQNVNPVRMNMTWSNIRQQMYFSWDRHPQVFIFNPTSHSLTSATGAVAQLANSFQTIYNDYTGKTFVYKRGGINQTNSTMQVLDTLPGEKKFLRFKAEVGEGAKLYARSITPILRGLGRNTLPNTSGLEFYVYNFATEQWILVGSNSSSTGSQTMADFQNSEIRQEFLNQNARNLISDDGFVEMMFTIKGNPTNGSLFEMVIDSVFLEGQF